MKDFAFALSQMGTDERQLTLVDILRDGDAASGTFYDFVTWDMFLAEGGTMPSLTDFRNLTAGGFTQADRQARLSVLKEKRGRSNTTSPSSTSKRNSRHMSKTPVRRFRATRGEWHLGSRGRCHLNHKENVQQRLPQLLL